MKVALITDTHFGIHKNSEVFWNNQYNFFVNEFVPYLKKNNINTIFHLGDVFDNRNSINVFIKNKVFELFDTVLKDFNVYLIVGNHDTYFNSSIDVHSLKFFSKFDNITVIDSEQTFKFDDVTCKMIPWIAGDSKVNFNDCDYCFGHFNINGFKYNKHSPIEESGIDITSFTCKKVFSGHFHLQDTKRINNTEIVYIGTPYHLRREDINEVKGITILDLNSGDLEFVENTVSLRYVSLNFPEPFKKKDIEGNIVDVHVDYDDKFNPEKIELYKGKILSYCPIMNPTVVYSEKLDDDVQDISGYVLGSIRDIIINYMVEYKLDDVDEYLREIIKEKTLTLYDSVSNY